LHLKKKLKVCKIQELVLTTYSALAFKELKIVYLNNGPSAVEKGWFKAGVSNSNWLEGRIGGSLKIRGPQKA
jgi:hypothetical protein